MGGIVNIRGIRLSVTTDEGDFGFDFKFARNLTVIRAKNSSGKSTLFNSVLYGLGMEELVGGKNERALPSAVKEHFEYEGRRIKVTTSEVLLEIENRHGKVVTLRRAIRDTTRDTKLVEVYDLAYLTEGKTLGESLPTYVHDAGGAKLKGGFHHYLEGFLGLKLPKVSTTNGGEAKLYLQAVFAALAVEQKRGWTDYIANIPFYGIRDARTRVVEFLLGLSVFDTNALRSRLNTELVKIEAEWRFAFDELRREAAPLGVIPDGVSPSPMLLFQSSSAGLRRLSENSSVALAEHISHLRADYDIQQKRAEQFSRVTGTEAMQVVTSATDELQGLSMLHERAAESLGQQRVSLKQYERLLAEANEDLARNKTAAKLRVLGAKHGVKTAAGRCPTCNQPVDDTLLADVVTGPQMDLATNIAYLESQRRMLQRQIAGLQEGIHASDINVTQLTARIVGKHDVLTAMRGDVISGTTESKAILRRQVQIEIEVEALERLQSRAIDLFAQLSVIADRMRINHAARQRVPKDAYTAADHARINVFQKLFRANAGSFGYESAPIADVEIGTDTLVPCLARMELKEIRTDIKSDSSASDFVRLIWSYLLAIHQTSAMPSLLGNHPGILMLDEPGQHSMAVDSQHALLKQLASETKLQSIVAASFDEAEEVFRQATYGITYQLIEWDGKLIRRLRSTE